MSADMLQGLEMAARILLLLVGFLWIGFSLGYMVWDMLNEGQMTKDKRHGADK